MGAASSSSFVLRAPAASAEALTVCTSHPAELTVTPSSLTLAKGAIAEATVPPPSPLVAAHCTACLTACIRISCAGSEHIEQATLLPQHSGKRMFIVNVLSGSQLCMVTPPPPLPSLLLCCDCRPLLSVR